MTQTPPPIRRREIAALLLLACVLLLPGLSSHTLVDPWEGHYAEVGRRILQDDDWIHLHWRDQSFRSKPALTPWLIATSLRAHGLAEHGGYSGEMVSTARVVWAVRLPFVLCAIGALLAVWLMLRRLISRQAAWLGAATLATTPFFCLVARQAITDMPMVAATTAALALLLLALHDGDTPLRRLLWRFTGYHVSLACFAVIVGVQVAYASHYLASHRLAPGMRLTNAGVWLGVGFGVGFAALVGLTGWLWRVRTRRGVYLLWAYCFIGISVLAKGPPGAVMAVLITTLYIIATRQWRLVLGLRVLEGALLALLVAAPWHVAMALRDGSPWLIQYIGHHWLKRAGSGVHMVNRAGDGTFSYYVEQLGVGLWPFVVVLPAALAAGLSAHTRSAADHVRLLATLWACAGLALFTVVQTKFHHYVLPTVPGFALLIALWLDDVIANRARVAPRAIGVGVVLAGLITLDVRGQQERIIELFVYRYDRPWPSGPPWNVNLSWELVGFGIAFMAAGVCLCVPRLRHWSALALLGIATVFAYYAMNRYMGAAGPHWGQGQLHRQYYAERTIHGVELRYPSPAGVAAAWPGGEHTVSVRSVIPETLEVGATMRVVVSTPTRSATLSGTVSHLGDDCFDVHVPAAEVSRLVSVVAGASANDAHKTPTWVQVDADRLIAWSLFWRSELFWSGGELWGRTADTRTDFGYNNDAGLRTYLARPEAKNRRYFVITMAGGQARLRGLLPTPSARASLRVLNRSSNKFVLLSFEM